MANTRIKNLAETTTLADGDVFAVDMVSPDETRKITKANLLASLGSVVRSVRVATTAAGTLATSFENGDTVDGIVLATGDRILIKNQAAGAENGVYTVNASGAPTRAPDADAAADLTGGFVVWIREGTVNADTLWGLTTDGSITIGVTALAFTPLTGSAALDLVIAAATTRVFGGALTLAGTLTAQGLSLLQGAVQLDSEITPTTLSASVNDYAPTGGTTASIWRISANNLWSITGIASGTRGRVLLLINVGTEPLNLVRESASSAAANRFQEGRLVEPGARVLLTYDSTAQRWRVLAPRNVGLGTPTQADGATRDFGLGSIFVDGVTDAGRGWLHTADDATDAEWDELEFRRARWARKTATFTLSGADRVILIDTGSAIDCDLPDPETVAGHQWSILLQRDSPGDVTFDRFGSEKIQGLAADFVLTGGWSKLTLFCDGVDWFFI